METEKPIHHEATLLPGYTSRTLSPEERQQVENHLKVCPTCQRELQEVQSMKIALKTAIQERPGPSPEAFSKVMDRIHREMQANPRETLVGHDPSWLEGVENAFRSLFEVRWAPVLATFLIVGQAFMLISVLGGPQTQVGPRPEPIIERGIPEGTVTNVPIKIHVGFVKTAQEIHIRELLQKLGGQILNGPTAEGIYTLGFPQTEMNSSESLLSTLRTHQDLIRSATPIHP